MSKRKSLLDKFDEHYEVEMPLRPTRSRAKSSAITRSYATSTAMPSSSSRVLDTPPVAKPPPIKRQRKMKDADAPAPEKRGAIFKKKCPKNILERLDRVASQRHAGNLMDTSAGS